jgi:hypothetical protein
MAPASCQHISLYPEATFAGWQDGMAGGGSVPPGRGGGRFSTASHRSHKFTGRSRLSTGFARISMSTSKIHPGLTSFNRSSKPSSESPSQLRCAQHDPFWVKVNGRVAASAEP